jgi:ATP-dependent DNA helicase RecG
MRLCEERWITRRQLAELLNRNEEGLRSRFLAPMVEHGRLRLRYPDKPNRVDQAYKKNIDMPENESF